MQRNILWTGGWDSTFHVVDCAARGETVQPFYIVDPSRLSVRKEIETIAVLGGLIRARYPDARIHEPIIERRDAIPHDGEIEKAYMRLKARRPFGRQYEWLARFARWRNIPRLELCVHRDDRAHRFVSGWAAASGDDPDVTAIFGRFEFPLLESTKLAMRGDAQRGGFDDILDGTWFCHSPRGRAPCGVCNPCVFTIEEVMASRFPPDALERFRSRRKPWSVASRGMRDLGALILLMTKTTVR